MFFFFIIIAVSSGFFKNFYESYTHTHMIFLFYPDHLSLCYATSPCCTRVCACVPHHIFILLRTASFIPCSRSVTRLKHCHPFNYPVYPQRSTYPTARKTITGHKSHISYSRASSVQRVKPFAKVYCYSYTINIIMFECLFDIFTYSMYTNTETKLHFEE